jgi:hypothetical protein
MNYISILPCPMHYRFPLASLLNPRAFLRHFSLCAPSAMRIPFTISVLYSFVFSVTEYGMFYNCFPLHKWNGILAIFSNYQQMFIPLLP